MIKKRVKTEQNMLQKVAEMMVKASFPDQGERPARKRKDTYSAQGDKKKAANGIDRQQKKKKVKLNRAPIKEIKVVDSANGSWNVELIDDDNVLSKISNATKHWHKEESGEASSQNTEGLKKSLKKKREHKNSKYENRSLKNNGDCPATFQKKQLVSDAMLLDGIRKLRTLAGWTETDSNPAFNDPGATLYLEVAHIHLQDRFRPGHWGHMKLPHPLSMNRSVCFLLESDEDVQTVEAALPNYPITGNVQVLRMELARQALVAHDRLALHAMVKRYDTVLYTADDDEFLQAYMYQEQKVAFKLENLDSSVENVLHLTTFWTNDTCDRVVAPVGHLGLTDSQLAENLQAVFAKQQMFPLNHTELSDIAVRTGTSETVSFFKKELEEEAEQKLGVQSAEQLREKKLEPYKSAAIKHEFKAQKKIREAKWKRQRASRELEVRAKKREFIKERKEIKENKILATQAKIIGEKLGVRVT